MNFYFAIITLLVLGTSKADQQDDFSVLKHGLEDLLRTGVASDSLKNISKNFQLKFDYDGSFYFENISGHLACDLCDSVAKLFLELREKWHAKENILTDLLVTVCDTFHMQKKKVCRGILGPQVDVLTYIMDNSPNLTGERVCALLTINFGCDQPFAHFNWTVDVPPKTDANSKQQKPKKDETFKILQISDVHFDPLYTPGANADCGEPLCCQNDQTDVKNPSDACGYWADYRNADVPLYTLKELLNQTKTHDFDMVYFTGDIVSHRVWSTSVESNMKSEKIFRDLLRKTYDVPIYHVLGNHEPHPLNFYSPNISNKNISSEWVFKSLADDVRQNFSNETIQTILKGGYYTVLIKPGFRLIVLNNNICQYLDIWLLLNDVDPYDQLKWLVQVLSDAEKNGEKVHILHHVPSGSKDCLPVWSREYSRIISRFSSTIKAQFNGHTHLDEFFLYYNTSKDDKAAEPVSVAFNGASVSTFVDINPSYKVYEVDTNTLEVLDFEEWTFNLTLANSQPKEPLKWFKIYSFKDHYNLSSLSPKSIDDLVINMAKNKEMLRDFIRFSYRLGNGSLKKCDADCEKAALCRIITMVPSYKAKCEQIKNIYDTNY